MYQRRSTHAHGDIRIPCACLLLFIPGEITAVQGETEYDYQTIDCSRPVRVGRCAGRTVPGREQDAGHELRRRQDQRQPADQQHAEADPGASGATGEAQAVPGQGRCRPREERREAEGARQEGRGDCQVPEEERGRHPVRRRHALPVHEWRLQQVHPASQRRRCVRHLPPEHARQGRQHRAAGRVALVPVHECRQVRLAGIRFHQEPAAAGGPDPHPVRQPAVQLAQLFLQFQLLPGPGGHLPHGRGVRVLGRSVERAAGVLQERWHGWCRWLRHQPQPQLLLQRGGRAFAGRGDLCRSF